LTPTTSPSTYRLESFDLLRGLCALAVGFYHLLSWQGVADLHNIGLFGVYIFFVLSGASITLAYEHKLLTIADHGAFLALRYLRLAPLYILVLMLAVSYRIVTQDGDTLSTKLLNVAPNLLFLFGMGNPGTTSLVIGGWSLGIEFLFYLLFPCFLLLLSLAGKCRGWAVAIFVTLLAIQQCFVNWVFKFGELAFVEHAGEYTQFLAFIAYFYCGCVIGTALKTPALSEWPKWRWGFGILLLALVMYTQTESPEQILTGFQGLAYMLLVMCLVYAWARLAVPQALHRISLWLGEASYGIYLLHPVIYQLLKPLGSTITNWTHEHSIALAITTMLIASISAWIFHRLVETRLMNWGKQRFQLKRPISTSVHAS